MTPPDMAARLLAFLLAATTPAAASVTPPAAPAQTMPAQTMDEAALRALLAQALDRAQQEDCPGLLGLLDPALPRLAGKDRNMVQLLRIQCLFETGRGAEAPAVYREMLAVDPQNSTVRGVGVFVAASTGDFAEAGRRLASLAEDNPSGLGAITSGLERGIAQALGEKREFALRDRLFLALARADWQPADQPEMRDSIAQGAIEALLARKQVDEASTLLPRVEMPELLVSMTTERLYQPLWPAIEARLGPHGDAAVDRFALVKLADFTRDPSDDRVTRDAVRAFVLLGRYADAGEVAGHVQITEGMSEEAAGTVRYHAQALAASGKPGEAIDRLRPFAMLDAAKTPAAVSGLVALAEMLDENGREADALAVARDALAKSGDALSPWGASWLERTQVCALAALGRGQEAGRIGDALRVQFATNQAAAIEALLCLKRNDEAAKLAIATLATSEGTSDLADQFQPDGAFWASAPSRLRALWGGLLARPDVRAAFEKTARILPRTLWPARAPRPIPRMAGDGPTA